MLATNGQYGFSFPDIQLLVGAFQRLADLDHVLLRDIDVAAFDRFPMPGTDHHAVTATLVPRRGQASAPPGRRASRS